MIKVGLYDDELEAVKAFGVKARELRKEHAADGHVKHEHKHTGSLCKLNFPTPEEQAQYDAAVAALAKKNICNAGDAAVWGDAAGDGFACATAALCRHDSEDVTLVVEGRIGYLCPCHQERLKYGKSFPPFYLKGSKKKKE